MYIFYEKYRGLDYIGTYFAESWPEFHSMTFSPEITVSNIHVIGHSHKGKSYDEKKAYFAELARMYQDSFHSCNTFYYSDIAAIEGYLAKQAKRFGLLREFRENGVI